MVNNLAQHREQALDILARLGAQPATSFLEARVARVVREALDEARVPHRTDDYGNIIAHLRGRATMDHRGDGSGGDGSGAPVPPIAFMAHMDHPGFEAIGVEGDLLIGAARGGVPETAFEPGVRLQVVLPGGERLAAATAGRYGEAGEGKALIGLEDPGRRGEVPLPSSVVFDLVDYQREEGYIRMRAVDDLAGCGSTLAMLAMLAALGGEGAGEPLAGDVYGVFTRAEEVGLVGARLLAEAGTLPKETLVVSLESSRTLPGAEIGGGPVIRVGDAGFTFDAEAESPLIRARETLQARPEGFKVQRQLMSGGTCEASAFSVYGYRTTGIAFPLGNYHNGAPDGGIEAEYIHEEDYLGGVELMLEAVRRMPERNDTFFRRRLREIPGEFRERMGGGS